MAWEYLQDSQMLTRMYLAAGYVQYHVAEGRIIDLNCGVVPLYPFLNAPTAYLGTDKNEDVIDRLRQEYPAGAWYCKEDQDVSKGLTDSTTGVAAISEHSIEYEASVGALVCMGYAARYSAQESPTLDASIVQIVEQCCPEVVVIESATKVWNTPRCGGPALLQALQQQGYRVDLHVVLLPKNVSGPTVEYAERVFFGLLRNPQQEGKGGPAPVRLEGVPSLSFEQIYTIYRELVDAEKPTRGKYKVLKTDVFNESETGYKSLGDRLNPERTVYLEYDREMIARAKQNHPDLDIRQGDIRALPFENEEFTCVFDLSTLDHIPPAEMPGAVAEYHRVLRKNGKLVCVLWVSEEPIRVRGPWRPGTQYYYPLPEDGLAGIERELFGDFRECRYQAMHRQGPFVLCQFVCVK